jgi:hypothetical protein
LMKSGPNSSRCCRCNVASIEAAGDEAATDLAGGDSQMGDLNSSRHTCWGFVKIGFVSQNNDAAVSYCFCFGGFRRRTPVRHRSRLDTGGFNCSRAAKIATGDNGRPRRPIGTGTDSGNPGTDGLSEPRGKIPGSIGRDGGDSRDRTGCPPRSHRNQSPTESGMGIFRAETGAPESAYLPKILIMVAPCNSGRRSCSAIGQFTLRKEAGQIPHLNLDYLLS